MGGGPFSVVFVLLLGAALLVDAVSFDIGKFKLLFTSIHVLITFF